MVDLSIIIPVFNKVSYIDQCIESVLNQTLVNFELILVNDGSTDGSAERCSSYLNSDQRIKLINQENSGVSSARNIGMYHAKGKFIGFVDADDTIQPDMYELLFSNAVANKAEISGCGMRIIPSSDKDSRIKEKLTVYDHEGGLCGDLRGDFNRSVANKIFARKIAKACQFEGAIHEDILFSCQAFIVAERSVYTTTPKYNYLIRDNSASMKKFNSAYFETVKVSKKIVELVSRDNQSCLPAAKAFDVLTNLSLLNLLILEKSKLYEDQYKNVKSKLESYDQFIKKSSLVNTKHKLAWYLFSISPAIYRVVMHCYCVLTDSDVIHRTRL